MELPGYFQSIHHDGSRRYLLPGGGSGLSPGDRLLVRLRAAVDAPVAHVLLRTEPDGEQRFTEMAAEPLAGERAACRWWRAEISIEMPLTRYRFLIFTPHGALWYNGSGLHPGLVTDAQDFRLLAGYAAPHWVRDSVFYQIFPDRFADGDPANNVRSGEYTYRGETALARRWGERPSQGTPRAMVEFFGGDLAGIEQRLDHIQELGANALYLNPIFTAFSNHRYDVVDYFNVDPHLGGNAALVSLREATRRRGMRLMLDIVPNHCGVMHPWFQEAAADPAAPSADFFTFTRHPDQYASWLGVASLPKFDYRSTVLREIMYEGAGSVFRTWLKPPYAVDAWRLDVANMLGRQGAEQLGFEVGRGIRRAVKETNPEAYLLGENFFDAGDQLQGDLWDAAMNYSGFAKPLWYWLSEFNLRQHTPPKHLVSPVRWPTQALVESWAAFRAAIPWEIARQQYNLLGSHDTERILTVVRGDPGLARLAAGILMTYPGVPSIYYGDEVGMGRESASQRDCMVWDRAAWDPELYGFYRRLAHLRRSSPALIEGGFQVLQVEEDFLAYQRDTDEETVLVAANRGPRSHPAGELPVAQAGLADGTVFEEIFSGVRAQVKDGRLPLPALTPGIQIWKTVG